MTQQTNIERREHPILFSGPMVRALLEGRKTQTRRVLKPQLGNIASAFEFQPGQWKFLDRQGCRCHQVLSLPIKAGDRLWVRETFAISGIGWGKKPSEAIGGKVHFQADPDHGWQDYWGGWKPSIHMPRWASRLTLVVTDVRVQRLQQISGADSIDEGVKPVIGLNAKSGKDVFRELWDGLNAKRGFGWDANPWVAAYSFTVHHQNTDREAG